MQSSRRSFLRGVASIAGVASAQTAYAQHGHPAPQPQQRVARPPEPVPRYEFGPGIVPVLSPDVPNMPWPATTALLVKLGERVRIQLVNLGMDPSTAPKTTHQGRTYYFSSEQSLKQFLENPAKFVKPGKK